MTFSYEIIEKNINLTKRIIIDYSVGDEELEVLISRYY